jgi:hypothetical protein
MLKTCDPFARVTEHHDLLALKLTPCAGFLYRILLRAAPAGKPQEFELKKFCAWADYSLRWAKAALRELCDLELVEVLRTFSGQGYKLVAYHPDRQKTSPINPETSTSGHETSKKLDSNPYPIYSFYRESKETTDKPTHHSVSQEGQESPKIDRPALASQTQSIEPQEVPEQETKQAQEIVDPIGPEISEKIKTAGFKLNSTLAAIVRSTQAQIVLEAIEAAQQYLTKTKLEKQPLKREPEAVLVSAIKNQWQPNKADNLSEVIPLPDNFETWYELARRANIARASSSQAEVTRHPQGVLCIETHGSWSTFDEMARCFPIPELEEMARKREEAINTPSRPPDHLKQKLAGLKKFGMFGMS